MQKGDSSSVMAKVTEERDLGLICDSDFNFTSHINNCNGKANQRVGLIRRSFGYLDEKSFLILYKTLVRPILEYCPSVWYPICSRVIARLTREYSEGQQRSFEISEICAKIVQIKIAIVDIQKKMRIDTSIHNVTQY